MTIQPDEDSFYKFWKKPNELYFKDEKELEHYTSMVTAYNQHCNEVEELKAKRRTLEKILPRHHPKLVELARERDKANKRR